MPRLEFPDGFRLLGARPGFRSGFPVTLRSVAALAADLANEMHQS